MPSVDIEVVGRVGVLRVEHGRANALDTELCRQLTSALAEADRAGHSALVLTGHGGMFSAGVDLRRIVAGGPAYIREFLPALSELFLALFGFPAPVVAAVNGHAIAGGAVLAAACDRRVMQSGDGRIGVTELLVGVPFPLSALEILRCAVGSHRLTELTYLGRTYPASEALVLGLVDEVVDDGPVLARATALAETLAAIPAASFRHTKRQLRAPFQDRIAAGREADDARLAELWTSADLLAAISGYVERVLNRS